MDGSGIFVAAKIFVKGFVFDTTLNFDLAVNVMMKEIVGIKTDQFFRKWFRLDEKEPPEVLCANSLLVRAYMVAVGAISTKTAFVTLSG